jgi:hypothetical protein
MMMSNEDYMYIEQTELAYVKVVNLDGVKTTISSNRFEISVQANTEIWEQLAVQHLRDWIRWRKEQEELRESRSVSG